MTMMTRKLKSLHLAMPTLALGAALAALAAPASAQQAPQARNSASILQLPSAPTLFSTAIPSVVKASAIVNGSVITQTDINQRVALLVLLSGEPLPPEELEPFRQQVLARIIDERLQIQAAERDEINVSAQEIDRAVKRFGEQFGQSVEQLSAYLDANASSLRSLRDQIRGEIAWSRVQSYYMEDHAAIGDDEVQAVIDKLQANKGQREYRVSEIFLAANETNKAQVMDRAVQILNAIRQGQPFASFANQYSEASTAGVGGDLGWVKADMLAAPLDQMLVNMTPNSISRPVEIDGGISIIALVDTRQILTADPRNAILSLKQVTVPIRAGMTTAAINDMIERFGQAAQASGGCGGADKLAEQFGGDVVSADGTAMRDLPGPLQNMMSQMQVGQSTQPFGSVEEGARVLILCGRDQQETRAPTFDEVYQQLNQKRIELKAQRFLRDLRRDAIIEYR